MSDERTNCTRCNRPFSTAGRATNLRTGEPAALCSICHKNMIAYRAEQAEKDRATQYGEPDETMKWHNLWPVSAHFERR